MSHIEYQVRESGPPLTATIRAVGNRFAPDIVAAVRSRQGVLDRGAGAGSVFPLSLARQATVPAHLAAKPRDVTLRVNRRAPDAKR